MNDGSAQSLAASFGRAARTYGARAAVQEAMADWLAQWLPADRSGAALEVGAGTGIFTRRLLPWEGLLTASDFSSEMSAIGRGLVPEATWTTMQAEKPVGGPWSWIFSSSMLQWAIDPTEVFAAWRKSLVPGGRVLGGVFAAESLAEWNALAGETAPLRWRTPGEWRSSIEAAGLGVLRDESERRVFTYPSALALLRSLHDVGGAPHRRYAAGQLRRLLREYESKYRAPDGVSASWVFYRFEASKGGTPLANSGPFLPASG